MRVKMNVFAGLIVGSMAVLVAGASRVMAGCCYVDDPSEMTCKQSPIQTDEVLDGITAICGQKVHGGGTGGCVVEVMNDVNWTGGDCLELGYKVTIEGNGHDFNCTDASCGKAVKITGFAGSSSSPGEVMNLDINGCWSHGVHATTTNANAEDNNIDLDTGTACSGATVGLEFMKTASRNVIRNADIGAKLRSGDTLSDSIVRDAPAGIGVDFTSVSGRATLTNVFFHELDTALEGGGSADFYEAQGIVVANDVDCQCSQYGGGSCDDPAIGDCIYNFTGAQPSFMKDVIY